MKKRISFIGMLTIAAILIVCFSACNDEGLIDNPVQPTQPQKIHVTVGAGIGDAQTRSEVEKNGTTRTLKFTTGDRLYIVGNLPEKSGYLYRMGGYLTLVGGAGTTSATFEGDLTVWKYDTYEGDGYVVDNNYTLQHPDNPMLEYGSSEVTATLVHKDAIADAISINNKGFDNDGNKHGYCSFNYNKCLLTGNDDKASELMKSGIHVRGTYDATTGKFPLACSDPIFNCNFTTDGLAANTSYYVRIVKDSESTTYEQRVTSDANGYVQFTCTSGISGSGYWAIQLCEDNKFLSNVYERPIGNKALGAKVYNVGNFTTPDPGPGLLLSNVTSEHIGYIVGITGNIYPPGTPLLLSSQKRAMICYVSSPGHGLAIELNSNPDKQLYKDVKSAAEGKAAVAGGTWRLPTLDDWENMVTSCGGANDFIAKYNATGVTMYLQYSYTEFWASDSGIDQGDIILNWATFEVTNTSTTPQYNYSPKTKYTLTTDEELGLASYYYLACLAF